MTLALGHRLNLETLLRAAKDGRLAVLECRRRADGKTVPLLVAVGNEGENFTFTPFAEMFETNPFKLYDPPDPNGGFVRPN